MTQYIGRFGASIMMASLVALGACKSDRKANDSALATDTALNRDLSMAGQDTAAQPQLTDVPNNPPATTTTKTAPRTTTPRTTTPRTTTPTTTTTRSGNTVTRAPAGGTHTGGGSVGTVAAGTSLALSSTSRVCTNTNHVGDRITATTSEAVSGTNGVTIPAGATVTLTITALKRSNNMNDPIRMEFAVNSITFGGSTYALDATVASADVQRVRATSRQQDATKVAAGAVVGAIAGQVIGRDTKSTVIGAAAGAAAGAGAAAATANYDGCINQGGSLSVRLSSPVQIRG